MPVEMQRVFEQRAGAAIIEGWGCTGWTGTSNPLNGERAIGSIGKALGELDPSINTEIRIVDDDGHDNDADKGDEERVIHVVDGGDSGWRIGYQWPVLGNNRDPWLNEDIFVNHTYRQSDYYGGTRQPKRGKGKPPAKSPDPSIRPAAYLPHVGNCGDGPAGLAYNPGVTGLTAISNDAGVDGFGRQFP